jgi:energy-coupling factor transporter transmembrane protein EcfT
MPILLRLILTALVAFSLGVATAPLWLAMVQKGTTAIAPFSLLSLAILVFSIAYAIRTVRRPPR